MQNILYKKNGAQYLNTFLSNIRQPMQTESVILLLFLIVHDLHSEGSQTKRIYKNLYITRGCDGVVKYGTANLNCSCTEENRLIAHGINKPLHLLDVPSETHRSSTHITYLSTERAFPPVHSTNTFLGCKKKAYVQSVKKAIVPFYSARKITSSFSYVTERY